MADEVVGGVRFSSDDRVARVTLARPDKRNAQTPETWQRLREIGDGLPPSVRAVVVTGEGSSFSAGLDRSMFGTLPGQLAEGDSAFLDLIAGYQAGFSWLRRPDFISVAGVQGHAVGAGFQLALACDVRIAATDAQFTMAEPSLGLVPDLGGTQVLVDLVGYSRALEICATGRRVGADEAREIGLVTAVVPPGDLAAAVDDFVEAVAAAPHGAVSMTKALLLGARDRSYADQLLAERQAQLSRIRSLAEDLRGSESHA
ncbi:MAG: enoyl-CoA hydratase/isomerase family protein [Frankiales bacterium]|nr:enoyl-CoA hydratase/isomerase family protein [Frankiales bacterium]